MSGGIVLLVFRILPLAFNFRTFSHQFNFRTFSVWVLRDVLKYNELREIDRENLLGTVRRSYKKNLKIVANCKYFISIILSGKRDGFSSGLSLLVDYHRGTEERRGHSIFFSLCKYFHISYALRLNVFSFVFPLK